MHYVGGSDVTMATGPIDGAPAAVATLMPVGDSGVSGTVHFQPTDDGVRVHGTITGLTPGKHGFHVHEFGDLSDLETGASAGGHFAPRGMPHGDREADERHAGDLGNIEADESGKATFNFVDEVIGLDGEHSILGRAVVVHEKADQFTQPSGDAGGRVAVGVIGVANKASN